MKYDLNEIMRVTVDHAVKGTMDFADSIAEMPVDLYTDPARFELERQRIFRRLPLMLAPSCELPNPGDYKAMEAVGVPLLLVRGGDGVMRAFLNSCTHRGARVAVPGKGNAKRFTCLYHGWTYGRSGDLIAITAAEDFGEIDRKCRGLKELPAAERAGLIFVTLDPDSPISVDDYLGEFGEHLRLFDLKDWHFMSSRTIPGPNWKLAMEGTFDYYHLPILHQNTVIKMTGPAGNRSLYWEYGPHMRATNPDVRLSKLANIPQEEWPLERAMANGWVIFPCANLSVFNQGGLGMLGMQILPGDTVGTSITNQFFLMRNKPEGADAEKAWAWIDLSEIAVRDEDYVASTSQQAAMRSGLMEKVTFGRNEKGNQIFHRWVEKIVSADGPELASTFGQG